MMSEESIDIIIPVYNAEKTIERCINSVLHQTYDNYRIILVDDGSVDNSSAICIAYQNENKCILYYHKENGGAASARNYGLKYSTSKYVTFVDSDDEVKKDYLADLYKGIQKADLSLTDMVVVNERKDIIRHYKVGYAFQSKHELIGKKAFFSGAFLHYEFTLLGNVSGKMFKSEIIKSGICRFDEKVPYGEEAQFVKQYMQNCTNIFVTHESDYIYYSSKGTSLSSKSYKKDIVYRTVLANTFLQIVNDAKIDESDYRRIANNLIDFVELSLERSFEYEKKYEKVKQKMLYLSEMKMITDLYYKGRIKNKIICFIVKGDFALAYEVILFKYLCRKIKSGVRILLKKRCISLKTKRI